MQTYSNHKAASFFARISDLQHLQWSVTLYQPYQYEYAVIVFISVISPLNAVTIMMEECKSKPITASDRQPLLQEFPTLRNIIFGQPFPYLSRVHNCFCTQITNTFYKTSTVASSSEREKVDFFLNFLVSVHLQVRQRRSWWCLTARSNEREPHSNTTILYDTSVVWDCWPN